MQQSQRQKILNLLNLDSMINQYLAQPNRHIKKTHKNKSNCINSLRNTNITLDHNNTIKTRVSSVNTFKKNKSNTISYRKDNRKCQSTRKFIVPSSQRPINNLDEGLKQNKQSKYTLSDQKTEIPIENNYPLFQKSELQFKQKCNIFRNTQVSNFSKTIKKQEEIKEEAMRKVLNAEIESPQKIEIQNENAIKEKQLVMKKSNKRTDEYLLKRKKVVEGGNKLLKSRYMLEKIIGRGLSGVVYQAKDILSKRTVAIKIIDLANEQEYDFIKKLSHQNMIQYYNCFEEKNSRYLVLQYLPMTLSEVVKKYKLDDQQIFHIFTQIANGVLYLHSMSYAHRDIKLDNIVISDDFKTIKFIDFGLCLDVSNAEEKQLKRFCGTTSYLAPQIIQGKSKDPKKADIWALGVVLYALAVGRPPFVGRQQMQVHNKIRNNKLVFPSELNESIKQLLRKILNKKPQQRPNIFSIINHNWNI